MWRFLVFAFAFLFSTVVGAENENDSVSWSGSYYEYDEATIKDRIANTFLWNGTPDYDCRWSDAETTLYDTKHGMILTVVLLQPERVEALYEKRLSGRNVREMGRSFIGGKNYADIGRHDGRELMACFSKI